MGEGAGEYIDWGEEVGGSTLIGGRKWKSTLHTKYSLYNDVNNTIVFIYYVDAIMGRRYLTIVSVLAGDLFPESDGQ